MSNNRSDEFGFWLKLVEAATSFFRKPGYSVKKEHTTKFDALDRVAYDEKRNEIHNGDLLFCSGNHWLSKVIRYFSGRSKVSHVGIIFWWQGRLMLLESVESDGVRIVPLSHYISNYENSGKPYDGQIYIARHREIHREPEHSDTKPCDIVNALVSMMLRKASTLLNKEFSIGDFLAFFWRATTGHGEYDENDHYLCSEFVAECFKGGAGIVFKGDGAGFIAPEHIAMADEVDALIEIDTSQGGSAHDRL